MFDLRVAFSHKSSISTIVLYHTRDGDAVFQWGGLLVKM